MNENLLFRLHQYQRKTNLSDKLQVEREFRSFIMTLLSNPEENSVILSSLLTILPSELEQLHQQYPFAHISKLFTEGGKTIQFGENFSEEERKQTIISLVPQSMKYLQQQIRDSSISCSDMCMICQCFEYFRLLEIENENLEARIKSQSDIGVFHPDSVIEFISSVNHNSQFNLPQNLDLQSLQDEVEKKEILIHQMKNAEHSIKHLIDQRKVQIINLESHLKHLDQLIQNEKQSRIHHKEQTKLLYQETIENYQSSRKEAFLLSKQLHSAINENRILLRAEKNKHPSLIKNPKNLQK